MQPHLEPLSHSSRVDGVAERLRDLILSGELPAGGRLPNERELADSLGVNRSSVREALKRLEFLELIEVRHGQGSFVRALSESSALQVIEALLADPRTITRELLRQLLEQLAPLAPRWVERQVGADHLIALQRLARRFVHSAPWFGKSIQPWPLC